MNLKEYTAQFNKRLSYFVDEWGMIGQRNEFVNMQVWIEGGDSLNRNSMLGIAMYLNGSSKETLTNYKAQLLRNCRLGPGAYRRHPDTKYWYSSALNTSKDQIRPLMCFLGLTREKKEILAFMAMHSLRLGFFQNIQSNWEAYWNESWNKWVKRPKLPDWEVFETLGICIRGLRAWVFYPLLYVLDVFTVLGAINSWRISFDPKASDDNVRIILLLTQCDIFATIWTRLACYIYNKRRGYHVNLQSQTYQYDPNVYGPQYALDYYFRCEESPPLNEELSPCLEILKRYKSIWSVLKFW